MTAEAYRRPAVVGATAWGTTLAVLLARHGLPTLLLARDAAEASALAARGEHERRLPGVPFPPALCVTAGDRVLRDADLVVFAVPSVTLEGNARRVAPGVAPDATVLSATKGIERGTGRRMSEVLAAVLPGRPVAVLSGPNLSREVARGLPATAVIASRDAGCEALADAFRDDSFRVYTSRDVVGVELGGALKNVIAIAAGIADAGGYGDNAKAALITRGLAEITRLGVAAGADPLTFQGLAGMGDLIATAYSPLSRNRRLGELLGSGRSLEAALAEIGETAEGAQTIPAALHLARSLGVEMPITAGLHAILYEGLPVDIAVQALLGRMPGAER